MVARANIPVFYNFFSRFTYYNSTFVVHFNIGAMTFHEMEATGDLLLRYLRIYQDTWRRASVWGYLQTFRVLTVTHRIK